MFQSQKITAHIGLLGGTFNPIHYGHLRIAEQAAEALGFDQVWFVPNRQPPHRENPNVTALDRLEMVRLAIKGNHLFKAESLEIDDINHQLSYTFDTINTLRKRHPQMRFSFIGGSDSLLTKWYKLDEIMNMLEYFCIVHRPGCDRARFEQIVQQKLRRIPPQIYWLQTDGIDISSTALRTLLGNKLSVRYLLPDDVIGYICSHNLYTKPT